jgi:hypothetical protein
MGMLVVEKVRTGAVMMMMKLAVELPQEGSATLTSTGNVPGVEGVPMMDLPEAINPGGVPDMDQAGAEQVVPLQVAEKLAL